MSSLRIALIAASLFPTAIVHAPAQQPALHSIAELHFRTDGPVLRSHVAAGEPFTVAGLQGILVGQQQGPFEAWILPVKLLSHLTIQADVEGYPVPLDLNSMAREIEVRPDRTTITYSHIAVTVRQILFAPGTTEDDAPSGTGAVVLFQVDAVRPVKITIRFTPELREMWPEPNGGVSPEWVPNGPSGLYILHSDSPTLAAAIAIPGATSGIMAPYQERPQIHPLELIFNVDPAKDRNRLFPLLMAVGRTAASSSNAALAAKLNDLDDRLPALYAAHVKRYAQQERDFTSIVTPDAGLDSDLLWAETSIGQLRARTAPTSSQPNGEIGLVAGYYASGDSARPGFGWYFGRDSLYTLYAVDSYGDFALARTELEFLLRRQRADGKVMHEYSQTAAEVDWQHMPYEYAAADATPLMLTVMLDYVQASGDLAFLQAHRDAIMKAWNFESSHDSDGDGIYDNSQGTGWVESWPTGMPHQEIYLALLDEQASSAMAQLATLLDDKTTAASAAARAASLHATIEREYYRPGAGSYAFSRSSAGKLDTTATIFPSIAWWNEGGTPLDHPEASLRHWASHDFDTDWGLRDIAESDPFYDPISYHQGSVWPLFTGWAALAEYRTGHPLAGYQATMQNADLTTAQDLGAVTELLSGAFFEPFGRSTSHQLWSSAMVVTPVLRGLFGISLDALHHTVEVSPHLPASWPSADVLRLKVGDSVVNLHYKREAGEMLVSIENISGTVIHFDNAKTSLRVPLPAFEISIPHGLPVRGARTSQIKVIEETTTAHSLHLEIEGMVNSDTTLALHRNGTAILKLSEGATLAGDELHIHFPAGTGYVTQPITLNW
jgi:glycogen debranching enzyme